MHDPENAQLQLRQRTNELLSRLPSSERQALLIKCWMSHDARWFMAVAQQYGLQITNRLNQIAAHEIGKVKAQHIVRALGLPPAQTLDDYLLMQEIFIGLLGPALLGYRMGKTSDMSYQTHVQRCFAYDNAVRAGMADDFNCGILARVTGWMEALGLQYGVTPSIGRCLKSQVRECLYTVIVTPTAQGQQSMSEPTRGMP
jgi:hypothetical protein